MFLDPLALRMFITFEVGASRQAKSSLPVASRDTVKGRRREIGSRLVRLLGVIGGDLIQDLGRCCDRSHLGEFVLLGVAPLCLYTFSASASCHGPKHRRRASKRLCLSQTLIYLMSKNSALFTTKSSSVTCLTIHSSDVVINFLL
jgi:hypothetical protein